MTMNYAMGAMPPTASHLGLLERELCACTPGSLVVEDGCGLYSTLVVADRANDAGLRVICIESNPIWAQWARWAYKRINVDAQVVENRRDMRSQLADASLVFIDGAAKQRIKLLTEAQAASVPTILMHDTEPMNWHHYDLRETYFDHKAYKLEHDIDGTRRTTLWRLSQ